MTPAGIMSSPPVESTSTSSTLLIWLGVAAVGAVLFVGLLVAAVSFLGKNPPADASKGEPVTTTTLRLSSTTNAPGGSSSGGAGRSPSDDPAVAAFAQRYLALAGTIQPLYKAYVEADDLARVTPCTCPPGYYDHGSALPALQALVDGWAAELPELEKMQANAPPVVAKDLAKFIAIRGREIEDGRVILGQVRGRTPNSVQADWVQQLDDAALAAGAIRTDVGLPLQ